MNIKSEIRKSLDSILKEYGAGEINYLVESPENEKFGDYSSNIAMILWSNSNLKTQISKLKLKSQNLKSPLDLAKLIAEILNTKYLILNTEKAEAVAPGFINFWISKEYLRDKLKEISDKKDGYGEGESLKNKKVMVEFTDPNPFKEFHIGHLYTNVVGESISCLLAAQGAELKRANYQGDVGMHIAKSLYAILQISNLKSQISNLEKKSAKERAEFLGECYAVGAKAYEESEGAKKEIEQINKKVYAKDPEIMPIYEKGRAWSLEYFETIYKRLGTKFDYYFFESEVGIDGLNIVKKYLKKGPPATPERSSGGQGVFENSQGAVIFPGKKQGLHDRVFINSLGLPTYEAKDIGLAVNKYKKFPFDLSISVTANEIIGYFKVIIAALKQINPELASKIKHLPHGMVRLPTGKMSSRTGNVVTGEWLLDEAKKLLKSKFPEMTEATLEKVAVGAVKYALLKSSIGHDVEFDFEESISMQGNSGPYIQYTYARTQSVLSKCHSERSEESREILRQKPQDDKFVSEELSLMRMVYRFPEVVEQAARKYAPNILCTYLFNLAQKYNLFYQKCKILQSRTEQREFRLSLTAGVGQVIKTGLYLLGIQAPEKM